MMLVAGFSGIGKTAVVNEVHKPIVKQRGYFIQRKIRPISAQYSFYCFCASLPRFDGGSYLSEIRRSTRTVEKKIFHALGENGQVIVEVIPELEKIIGKQADRWQNYREVRLKTVLIYYFKSLFKFSPPRSIL
jgi:predicted ATPase